MYFFFSKNEIANKFFEKNVLNKFWVYFIQITQQMRQKGQKNQIVESFHQSKRIKKLL